MNETLKNISNLKTTRSNNFSENKISNEDLEIILQSSVRAPNASNRQSYSIIILNENEREELGLKGDKVLLYVIDFYRHECLKKYLGSSVSFEHFQPFMTGIIDVSLAIQNAVIAANSLNIGYLVTNDTYTKDLEKIFTLFQLPQKGCFPLLYLCLGYPEDKTMKQKSRIDINHIVHSGIYRDYSQDEIKLILNEYNNYELELFTNWKEKGYEYYLDWFYSKWTPALEKKEKSLKLLSTIKSIGFID